MSSVVSNWAISDNMTALGYSPRVIPLANAAPGAGSFNSDLAFQGDTVVQGTYAGFRLVDVTYPSRPKQIVNWEQCNSRFNTQGNQGDVLVWGNLVMRSWNSPTPAPIDPATGMPYPSTTRPATRRRAAFCGDWPMYREPANPALGLPERGQEGEHIIDISDPKNPEVIAFVDTPCGSHTETLVPDLANNRLLVYSNASANTTFGSPTVPSEPLNCRGIDILQVPLANPAAASYLRFEPSGDPAEPVADHHACHDTAVILGDAQLVACSGGNSQSIWTIDPAMGGSKADPLFMHHVEFQGVGVGHTSAFTYDGKYAIFGHEPGGGARRSARRRAASSNRTLYFVAIETGEIAGPYVQERPQTALENCTWHNLNVVPLRTRTRSHATSSWPATTRWASRWSTSRDVTNAKMIAYADPPPLVNPDNPGGARARRRLVELLVQRPHLRVRHHEGPDHLAPRRSRGDPVPADAVLQPADAGLHDHQQLRPPGGNN